MDSVTIFNPDFQAKLDAEIRTTCRNLLTENGGINKAGPQIGIHHGTLWNQLTDGRMKRIPATTVALVSAFTKDIRPLDRLCRAVNHVALPIIGIPDRLDDTKEIASEILYDLGRMIIDKKHRQDTGRNLMRKVYLLANRGK